MPVIRLAAGYLLDTIFGDPADRWHPISWIGKLVNGAEKVFFPAKRSFRREFVMGFAVLVMLAGGLGAGYVGVALFLRLLYPPLFWAIEIYLVFSFLAFRTLHRKGEEVLQSLRWGDLSGARRCLSHMVGRDTKHLSEWEVVRGCVESLAENFSDGFVAPFLYVTVFGGVGGLVYKTVNTMDSMLGHRDFRYFFFGFASARFDDLVNFIPARLSAFVIILAALLCGGFWRSALYCARRDARFHPSPNAGWPEAAMAGALGVRLGGTSYYRGRREERPFMGEPLKDLDPERIEEALRLLRVGNYLAAAIFLVFSVLIALIGWSIW